MCHAYVFVFIVVVVIFILLVSGGCPELGKENMDMDHPPPSSLKKHIRSRDSPRKNPKELGKKNIDIGYSSCRPKIRFSDSPRKNPEESCRKCCASHLGEARYRAGLCERRCGDDDSCANDCINNILNPAIDGEAECKENCDPCMRKCDNIVDRETQDIMRSWKMCEDLCDKNGEGGYYQCESNCQMKYDEESSACDGDDNCQYNANRNLYDCKTDCENQYPCHKGCSESTTKLMLKADNNYWNCEYDCTHSQ